MKKYKSCDQKRKNVINESQIRQIVDTFITQPEVVITLDDTDNGSCSTYKRCGFQGHLVVIQRDPLVATQQLENWDKEHPDHNKYTVHVNDITKQFLSLCRFWTRGKIPRLWNFDYYSTFFTEIPAVVKSILSDPSGCIASDEKGTVFAFTFQAIANGRILATMTNIDPEKVSLWKSMKKWTKCEIAQYYTKLLQDIVLEFKQTCVTFEPIPIEIKDVESNENAIVYSGSNTHFSTMMFVMYKARHSPDCKVDHAIGKLSMEDRLESSKRKMDTVERLAELEIEDETQEMNIVGEDEIVSDSETNLAIDNEEEIIPMEIDVEIESEQGICDICKVKHFKHQLEAIDALLNNTRGIISIPCGCGKSYIIKHIAGLHRFSAIYAPTKNLVTQIAHEYFEIDDTFIYFCINSDNKHNAKSIKKQIDEASEAKQFVFVVNYQSYVQFRELCEELCVDIQVSLFDEAHHTSSKKKRDLLENCDIQNDDEELDDDSNAELDEQDELDLQEEDTLFAEENDDIFSNDDHFERLDLNDMGPGEKRFFFTATPSRIMKSTPDLYGEIIYNYSFKQAVEDGIIKNFDTVLDLYRDEGEAITDDTVNYERLIENTKNIILEKNCKRILIYTKTVVENNNEPSVLGLKKNKTLFHPFQVEFISASTKREEREKILRNFKTGNQSEVHIIVSCKTISEGIDIANCDMVVMLDLTKSETLIIQRGLRASRLLPEERLSGHWKNAVVYFPLNLSHSEFYAFATAEDKRKYLNENVRRSQYEQPMLILNSLKNDFGMEIEWQITKKTKRNGEDTETIGSQHDENLENLDSSAPSDENEGDDVLPKIKNRQVAKVEVLMSDEYEWMYDDDGITFTERMGSLLVSLEKKNLDELWWANALAVKQFQIAHGRLPSECSKDPEEKCLGYWSQRQKNIKRGTAKGSRALTSDKLLYLQSIPDWKWDVDADEIWWENAKAVKQFQMAHGRLPSQHSKYPEEKRLGNWSQKQKITKRGKSLRSRLLTPDKLLYLQSIPDWKWDVDADEVWWANALAVKQFQIAHGRLPSEYSKDPEEKRLGKWSQKQKSIKRGTAKGYRSLTSDKTFFLESISEWKWDIDADEVWWKNAQSVKQFQIAHGRLPSHHSKDSGEKRLGNWCSEQKRKKRGKSPRSRPLTSDKIMFVESIPGWSWSKSL